MLKLTNSLKEFLELYHRELIVPLTFGHIEVFTQEIEQEYLEWFAKKLKGEDNGRVL